MNGDKRADAWHRRCMVVLAAVSVIIAGLCLRLFGYRIGLPFFIVKYGGSLLWGSMVYLLIAALFVERAKLLTLVLAEVFAIAVELVRLVHTPWLDAFRETMAGALLLGKVFSPWNIVAYTLGIGIAALMERWSWRR
jgi:hypothetical protein